LGDITVDPVWYGGNHDEEQTLAARYNECLRLAKEHNLHSIAFPASSTGAYGYPPNLAAGVAVSVVKKHLTGSAADMKEVHFVLYDRLSLEVYRQELQRLNDKT
jgi:O-acetyl-ADP-ribose deacetylase (regulator of RNase III)